MDLCNADYFNALHNTLIGFESVGKKCFNVLLTSSNESCNNVVDDFFTLLSQISFVVPSFDYFAVVTSEGNGVVHLVLVDVFLPSEWFQDKWAKIRRSYICRKEEVCYDGSDKNIDALSHYFINQRDIVDIFMSEGFSNMLNTVNFSSSPSLSLDGVNRRLV